MASRFILVTVFVLDLIAFSLAVAAELRNYCVYDTDISSGLGEGSLLFLLVSQLMITAATRCLCCGRSRVRAIVFFISCWVTFLIAEACLLAASLKNAYHTKYLSHNPPSCETLRKGMFAAAAAFILFTAILSEFFYVTYSS